MLCALMLARKQLWRTSNPMPFGFLTSLDTFREPDFWLRSAELGPDL